MSEITVRQLVDLVASGVPDPQARLEKIFEWKQSRNLEIAKWLLALAAALLAAVAVGLLKSDATTAVPTSVLEITLFFAAAAAIAGLLVVARGTSLYRRHLAAQTLLGEITKIQAFVSAYREQT